MVLDGGNGGSLERLASKIWRINKPNPFIIMGDVNSLIFNSKRFLRNPRVQEKGSNVESSSFG